ncbi:site-specific integrase [Dysgonomonas termitidis]|uniref:Site-specific integrase n=1 Tax=Dysgonomonas termitidis TaxID=1516126 RepID=A0ABV9KZ70_9BACT
MRASIKIFQRNNYSTKDGKRQLCLRYTSFRQTTFIGLGISVHPRHWSQKRSMVLSGERNYLHYNRIIEEEYCKAENILLAHFYKPLSTKEFVDKFRDKYYGNTDFYVFIEKELELLQSTRAKQTLSNYRNLLNKMKEWKSILTFNEITLEFIQRFHDHEIKEGNLLSTIYKKHANFKFLLGLAIDKEQLVKNPYEKFEIKKITKAQNNDVLTEEELKILQQAYDAEQYTEGKREVLRDFLFSCYTSLSYAEFHNVTYDDLKPVRLKKENTEEMYQLLSNERQKTGVPYKIPIVSPVVELLMERKAGDTDTSRKIFLPLANQPTNRYLKEIMKDLGINKTMTFHRARHTFRTIAAKKGVRDSIAERTMGHAEGNDIQDIYTHLHDEDIVREMLDKWVV